MKLHLSFLVVSIVFAFSDRNFAQGIENTNFGGAGSSIVGGRRNFISGGVSDAFIGGGFGNRVSWGSSGSVVGGRDNLVSNGYSFIGGGQLNAARGFHSSILGGWSNTASGMSATISGGERNIASGNSAFVGGGYFNKATASNATVSGGVESVASGRGASVGGGRINKASGQDSTVGGGLLNESRGFNATVGGGAYNIASGAGATIPGGYQSRATHDGSFVWNGVKSSSTTSRGAQSFTVRAPGGVYFLTAPFDNISGVKLVRNATAWSVLSDRDTKENFKALNKKEILHKVANLPVTSWQYKHDSERRYIGPNAQDFHSAFGLGSDDKAISTLDSDGVIFAAVQGLVEELKERDSKIESMKRELTEFKARLDSMSPPPHKAQ